MTGTRNPEAYSNGYACGEYRRDVADYDPRWDFADAAKAGVLVEFKRGFEDGFWSREATP